MGDPAKADENLLPEDGWLSAPDYSANTAYLNVPANYQLVIDNLLDLTHAPYLHAATLFADPSRIGKIDHTFGTDGPRIFSNYHCESLPRSRILTNLFPHEFGESFFNMTWRPASTLNFDFEIHPIGGGRKGGGVFPSCHYLTPETETSTHYFFANGRNVKIDDKAQDEFSIGLLYKAFKEEDEPMLKACQDLMATTDLFSLGPVILPTDTPGVMARRKLIKMSAEEARASAVAALS
jgi:vanillate O-demethylase monooxygenase subunit